MTSLEGILGPEKNGDRSEDMDENERATITIALAGDVMLGRKVNQAIGLHGVDYPWGNTMPLLSNVDLTIANLECVIAEDGRPWDRTPKESLLRADPIAVDVLRSAGFDYVSLANNHSLDYGEEALLEMLEHLKRAGIAQAGAGRTLRSAARPALVERNGVKVGIVSFTDREPVWEATGKRPGTNYIEISTDGRYFARVKNSVETARSEGADLVIFSIHWGPTLHSRPSTAFRQFAYAVIDLGVDLFYGAGSHLVHGIEIYDGKPILYDTGDFVSDHAVDPELRNDCSLLFLLTASAAGVERIEMIPVLIRNGQVNLAQGADVDQIAERLQSLSSELGTDVDRLNDRLVIDLRRRHQLAAKQVG